MNGESRKQVALALASLAIGAVVAGILSNSGVRAKIVEQSKQLWQKARE